MHPCCARQLWLNNRSWQHRTVAEAARTAPHSLDTRVHTDTNSFFMDAISLIKLAARIPVILHLRGDLGAEDSGDTSIPDM
jgi:hypothetical protein